MLFDELRELAEMPFLVKHLTPKLGFGHHPVEVGRNDPIKCTEGSEKDDVIGLKLRFSPNTHGTSSPRSPELKLKLNARARKTSIPTT